MIRDLNQDRSRFHDSRESSKFITGSSNTGRVVVVYIQPPRSQGNYYFSFFYIQEIESFRLGLNNKDRVRNNLDVSVLLYVHRPFAW